MLKKIARAWRALDTSTYTACRKAALNYCPLVSCHEPQPAGPEESSVSGPARPGVRHRDIGGNEQIHACARPWRTESIRPATRQVGCTRGPGQTASEVSQSASQAATFGCGSVVEPPEDNFVAVAWLLPEQKTRRKTSRQELSSATGGGRWSLFLDRLAQGARESRQRARGHGIGRCMLQRARATTGELERWFRRDRAGPAHAPRASGSQDDTSLSPKSGRARPDSDCCACAAERRVVCTGRAPRFGGLPPSPCRR